MNAAAANPPVVRVKALFCPNCGGPVELRGFAHTLSAVCPSCHSILDASTPTLALLQKVQKAEHIQPMIPLGSRGTFENTVWEVIGFQIRDPDSEPEYGWTEYLLFNPYKGFRYLSQYQGHWNYIRVVPLLPEQTRHGGKKAVKIEGLTYTHFDHANAVTTYVLGEFPWRVRVGETAKVDDYVSPPYMVSSETTEGEVVWSRGEYYTSAQIWQAFQLKDRVPLSSGIFANQPSPYGGRVASAWRTWLWFMVALAAIACFFSVTAADKEVFHSNYYFAPGSTSEASFVTDIFELSGRPDNVQIKVSTDLDNNWAYFNFALIDETSGHAFDFGREVSYYHGRDSDGNWSEGGPNNSVKVPSIPSGRYYLRVEPEMDAKATPVRYELEVRRGVMTWTWLWVAALLLMIPPAYISIRSISFEGARWRESDYAPSHSSGGSD